MLVTELREWFRFLMFQFSNISFRDNLIQRQPSFNGMTERFSLAYSRLGSSWSKGRLQCCRVGAELKRDLNDFYSLISAKLSSFVKFTSIQYHYQWLQLLESIDIQRKKELQALCKTTGLDLICIKGLLISISSFLKFSLSRFATLETRRNLGQVSSCSGLWDRY